MKMAIKRKNDEFLVITLKHVDLLGILKLSALAHENGHKTRKWHVFGHALKHVSRLTVVLKRDGIPILWAITHENGHKTQKRRVLGHNTQTCRSPWNPKTIGISSCKRP